MPVFWILVYMWTISNIKVFQQDDGVWYCNAKPGRGIEFNYSFLIWVFLYLFIPAAILVALNIAIIVRLRQVQRLHKILTQSQPLSYKVPSRATQEAETSYSQSVTVGGAEDESSSCYDSRDSEPPASSAGYSMNSRTNLHADGTPTSNRFSIRYAIMHQPSINLTGQNYLLELIFSKFVTAKNREKLNPLTFSSWKQHWESVLLWKECTQTGIRTQTSRFLDLTQVRHSITE